jgi:pimeloyl-ACP methyl ester carboxylesterase
MSARASGAARVTVRHNRVELALHCLRAEGKDDGARPLLHLHGLGERSPDTIPAHLAVWPGPVWALDFSGHGESMVAAGGGYSCEVLMGDADHALAHLGESTVYGRGLGAYVALLIAGARPELVRGAILADGPGLAGGGPAPGSPVVLPPGYGSDQPPVPDPLALAELARDIRPADYATTFAHLAATMSGLDTAIAVVGANRPEWLAAVCTEPGVAVCGLDEALHLFAH